MPIEYAMDSHGGFFVARPETQDIEYAYPSSTHAKEAIKNPAKVAAEMIPADSNPYYHGAPWFQDRWYHMRAEMLKIHVSEVK